MPDTLEGLVKKWRTDSEFWHDKGFFMRCDTFTDCADELEAALAAQRVQVAEADKVEIISAKIHEGWMQTKRSQGITSRKSEKGEELMVPYEQLSEAAKDLDRGSVRSVLEAQAALAPAANKED